MPRKSAAAHAMTTHVDVVPSRLRPPADMPAEVAAVFRRLVASTDPRHFVHSDVDLLRRYCQAVVDAHRADQELAANGFVIDGKPSGWLQVQREANRAIATLSIRLRLSPQARSDPKTVARRTELGPPAIYDRLGWNDEADRG